MSKNAKIIIPAVAMCVFSLGIGTQSVYASEYTGPGSLIARIAQKFHVNENDVQNVFENDRQERQTYMQTQFENKLSDAVKDGKITEDQKQLILAKHADMKAERDAQMQKIADLSFDERRAYMEKRHEAMEQERAALEAWAKENGIDTTYLMFGGRHGSHGGFCGGMR